MIEKILAISLLLISWAGSVLALPAFPGAEGFGATTIGGRGGAVYKVTTLNDSGPGSLRAAVEAWPRHYATNGYPGTYVWESEAAFTARLESTGHRMVVFEVSGIINLESALLINYPYVTIAGQTSPGGVLVTGHTTTINNHDIIIQHMRFRVGSQRIVYNTDVNGDKIFYDTPQYNFPPSGAGGTCIGNVTTEALGFPCAISGDDPELLDAFAIVGNGNNAVYPNDCYNVVIDHCSFGWGVDETFSTGYNARDITIQWSIFSEALSKAGHPKGEHSKGVLFWGEYSPDATTSFHHNYLAHNVDRNPLSNSVDAGTLLDAVNNVVYNWGGLAMGSNGAAKVNWVQNYTKAGPSAIGPIYGQNYEVTSATVAPFIYTYGNLGAGRTSQTDPQWAVGDFWRFTLQSEDYRSLTPWSAPAITTSTMSYTAANTILSLVGATAPVRDSVDARVVADFAAGTGRIINNITYPDDFPTFSTTAPPPDIDNDGMADSWEASTFGNLGQTAITDFDSDGYTDIEEYLHYLAGGSSPSTRTPISFRIPGGVQYGIVQ